MLTGGLWVAVESICHFVADSEPRRRDFGGGQEEGV